MKQEVGGGADKTQKEQQRDRNKRWEREPEQRRRRRVRLQFVLSSHSAFVHPPFGAFHWTAEGQVDGRSGWGSEEDRKGEGDGCMEEG